MNIQILQPTNIHTTKLHRNASPSLSLSLFQYLFSGVKAIYVNVRQKRRCVENDNEIKPFDARCVNAHSFLLYMCLIRTSTRVDVLMNEGVYGTHAIGP